MSQCSVECTPEAQVEVNQAQAKVQTITPVVDVYEVENAVVIKAELPGLGKEDIEINVNQRVLSITGKAPVSEVEYRYQEYAVPNYYRQFKLGESLDQENIQANFDQGVLTLTIAVAESAKPRQIKVNVG